MTGRTLETGQTVLTVDVEYLHPIPIEAATVERPNKTYDGYSVRFVTSPKHTYPKKDKALYTLEQILDMFPVKEVHRAINIWHEKRTRPEKKIHNPKTGKDYDVTEHSSKYDPDKKIKGLWKSAPLSEEESYE